MLVIAGALTGLLVGLTGVGGGSLMTPLLLLVFGIAPMTAVGTDLWFAAVTKIVAARVHSTRGLIDWQVTRRMWTGSLTASAATLLALSVSPASARSVALLKFAVGGAVMVSATGMLVQGRLNRLGRQLRLAEAVRFKSMQLPLTVFAGAILGILVTLTSIGAGALGAPLLAYLYPLRLTPPRLIATDIVHAIPLAMFAGIGHLIIGDVNFGLLGNLLIGSIPGVIVGAMLSARLPHAVLKGILAILLFFLGLKLWAASGQ